MQRANLVATWIAEIGQVEARRPALAPTWRVFNALAAARDAGIVKGFNFFGAVADESYCATIGVSGWVAVNWFSNSEGAGRALYPAHFL